MIRYRKLGYVELNVSDLERSRDFYRDIVALEYAGRRGDAEVFRCDAEEEASVILHRSAAPGFKRAGWMLEDERQFALLAARLDAAGARWVELGRDECKERGLARCLRTVQAHCQATLEFYLPAASRQPRPLQVTLTKFQRLGHVVFATPEPDAAVAFFRDVLNFKVSDAIGQGVVFMRPFPSPWHHGIGIARAPRPQFHHLNFMVSEIDDVGRGLNRCNCLGVPVVFGPGRHIASGSMFLYFLDPDNVTLEYSFGMEEFDEFNPREPQVLPPVPESIDSWGAKRDPRMAAFGAMEAVALAPAPS